MSESDNLYEFLPREALADWAEVFGDKRRSVAAEEEVLRNEYNRFLAEFLRPATPQQLCSLNQILAQSSWSYSRGGYHCPCCGQSLNESLGQYLGVGGLMSGLLGSRLQG